MISLLDALVSLSAVAARTERLVLGTGVLLLPLRHAVWTAKQIATIAALAPDRLLLGVGVGGENRALRRDAEHNRDLVQRRLDEELEIVTRLLRVEAVDHRGPLLPTRSPALEPSPEVPPPLVVGGRSDAALRRAARAADGWLGVWMSERRVREVRNCLDELAAAYDRPPVGVLLMVFVNVTDDVTAGHAEAAAFVRGQYGLPYESLERWVIVGDEAHVAARLAGLRAAGVEGFVLMAASADPLGQYRRLAHTRTLIDI